MTLGLFMPLFALAIAPVASFLFLRQLRALPDEMSRDYDPARHPRQALFLKLAIAWQFLTPVLFYLIFNLVAPDVGGIELFQ